MPWRPCRCATPPGTCRSRAPAWPVSSTWAGPPSPTTSASSSGCGEEMTMTPVMNLGRLLTDTARRMPDLPGLVQGERVWTWSEINRRVDGMVLALRDRGIGKGDRILVHSRNTNVLFESMWVAFKLGAVWVPTNFRLTPPEVAYLGASSRARVMIYDRGFEAHVDAVKAENPALELVLSIAEPREGEQHYDSLIDLTAEAPVDVEEDVAYDDTLWFFYTSGTT